MPNPEIANLLAQAKTIAIVGLSPNPLRASHEVAKYLQQHAYRVIPINPREAGHFILNEYCYPSLAAAQLATGLKIDIVDCFRKAEDIPAVVEQAIEVAAKAIWMQLGISNDEAAKRAGAAGMTVVMDKCLKTEHARSLALGLISGK